MKKFFLCFFLVLSISVFGQEETLLDKGITSGGFGGPVIKFTSINKQFSVFVGGRGGWIINNALVIGGGGYGLVNNIKLYPNDVTKIQRINLGYGGFELEYIFESDKLVHGSIYLLLGGGSVTYLDWKNLLHADELIFDGNNNFFVAEPAVNLELNVAKFFRINVGCGYRYISGIDSGYLRNVDIAGLSALVGFKFGKF